jgi:hypothetical protein
MSLGKFNDATASDAQLIAKERRIARPVLQRTLQLIGGMDRLEPLGVDIECLKRTSLDIRNSLGLISQAASCLTRIEDTQGSLRDQPSP